MRKLRHLDLFSGIGGFALGLERAGGFETVAFCEIEPYCQAVLKKHWPHVPIFPDIRELTADAVGPVDIITGGFPCQDISNAGQREGIKGKQSGLWSEFARLIGEIRPRFTIVENVSALLGRGLGRVLGDISALRYDAEWHCIPASAVGAPHERERVWIVGYAERQHDSRQFIHRITHSPWAEARLGKLVRVSCPEVRRQAVPGFGRMDDGLPPRVDRLRGLGNAVVPQIPEIIGRAILEAEGWKP